MGKKTEDSGRKSRYWPGVRRSYGAEPISDALSSATEQELATILEKSGLPNSKIPAIVDEISDLVARYQDAESDDEYFEAIEKQRKSVRHCRSMIELMKVTLNAEDETRKRLNLRMGKERPRGQERYDHGAKRIDLWFEELSEAIDYAERRLPKLGGRRTKYIYARWLIHNLVIIWEEATDKELVVSKSKVVANKDSLHPNLLPRWFIETVLIETIPEFNREDKESKPNSHQITQYMNEAKNKNEARQKMSDGSDESDHDFG